MTSGRPSAQRKSGLMWRTAWSQLTSGHPPPLVLPCSAWPPCLPEVRSAEFCAQMCRGSTACVKNSQAQCCMVEDWLGFCADAGNIRPLPLLHHSLGNAAAAFRQLSAARYIGKIVVEVPQQVTTAHGLQVLCLEILSLAGMHVG